MAVAADAALLYHITRAGAGRSNRIGVVVVFPLGSFGNLDLTTARADLHALAIGLTGCITDDDALPCMAQGINIVALFDLSAFRAEITVIAQS